MFFALSNLVDLPGSSTSRQFSSESGQGYWRGNPEVARAPDALAAVDTSVESTESSESIESSRHARQSSFSPLTIVLSIEGIVPSMQQGARD